ncbi:MAG TPA: hypothetical protein VFE23_19435 [Usitatibacter sp.]|jgi:hypothetical protein|nr:hypothetical protein [Usitatibacter sp.]
MNEVVQSREPRTGRAAPGRGPGETVPARATAPHPGTMKPMKSQDSLEALYALIFAVCVLLALFLLVG